MMKKYKPLITAPPHSTIVVGFSGGPDSLFLLRLLHAVREERSLTLIAAHLNHGWRPESGDDAQFCKWVCDELAIPLIIAHASDISLTKKNSGSQEDLGRQLRRNLFASVAQQYHANTIALAHHADDQLETFFIRLIRGTTLSGLTCMKERDGLYWRPLLSLTKQEIVTYLTEQNIQFLTDPTNKQDIHLRNKIRNNVIPALRSCDARIDITVSRTINHLKESQLFIEKNTQELFTTICPDGTTLNTQEFKKIDPFIQRTIITHWLCTQKASCTFTEPFIIEILKFLTQTAGGFHKLNPTWGIEKKKSSARIIHQ